MRKVLLVVGTIVVLLFVAILIVPFVFKDRIIAAAVAKVSKDLDATVGYDSVDLTLIRSFPNLELVVGNLTLTGKEPFDGVVLARVADARVALDLPSVLSGGTIKVRALELRDADLRLLVDAEGRSNLDITTDEAPSAAEEPSDFALDLDAYTFENVALTYEDRQGGMTVGLTDLDATGAIAVSPDANVLASQGTIGALSVTSGGVEWLHEVAVKADVQATQAIPSGVITLGENRLSLNELALALQGSVTPEGDDYGLDVSFTAGDTPFAALLSLLPAVYSKDVAGLVTTGSVALQGSTRGTYKADAEDHLPGFDLMFQVTDGSFRYPSLPTSVDAVNLDLSVRHPEGSADLTEIDVKRFTLAVGGSPITGSFSLRHPMTDPDVAARVAGAIDLGALHQALPAASSTWQGRLEADLDLAGRVSQFTATALETDQKGVRADGRILVENFRWDAPSDEAGQDMVVDRLAVTLNPRRADITDLTMTLGASDIRGAGAFDNVIAYALTDATLVGRMDITSKFLDLDAFTDGDTASGGTADAGSAAGAATPAPSGESSILVVPKDLDITVAAKADRVRYGGHDATDARGTFIIKDGTLRIDALKMNFLGGDVGLSGTYAAATDESADIDMVLDLAGFDVSKTVDAFQVLQTIVPVAQSANGRFGGDVNLRATLGKDLSPDIASILSDGRLRTSKLTLTPAVLGEVADKLGARKFSTLDLADTQLAYVMEKGRILIQPTPVKVGGATATLGGSAGALDRTLDLDLGMKVPVGSIGAKDLLGKLGVTKGGLADVKVNIGGTYDKPTVKLDTGSVVEGVKETVRAGVDAATDKLVAEAQAQADALVAEAERQAAKLKAEAAKQGAGLKTQAKKQGDKLVAEAKGNPIALAAAKEANKRLLAEADKQIDKLEAEAGRQADAGIATAKKQGDKLIKDAEAKAKAGTRAVVK